MRQSLSLSVVSGILVVLGAACSGSGVVDPSAALRVRCAGGEEFCLVSCDLGCTQTGCAITEIAENQRLKFTFSDVIAVRSSSVLLAAGFSGDFEVGDRCTTDAGGSFTVASRLGVGGGGLMLEIGTESGTLAAGNQVTNRTRTGGGQISSVRRLPTQGISIRTPQGVAPEGDQYVSGSTLTFVPSVRTVNGISSFGFQRNESYIISIAGGPSASFGLQSVSGARLGREFTCTVVASLGIQDEDQQPPTVELVTPVENSNTAPLDPTIVLRFSELIDTTPLRGTLTSASPIRYTLRRATGTAPALVCDRDAQGTVLEGIPRLSTERVGDHDVTVVTFKPTVQLPGSSCVEVVVTADIRDLSGRQAIGRRFEFFTEAGVSTPIVISESFAAPTFMDVRVSAGTWNNGARPGLIGGDGRHGSFDPAVGTLVSSTEFTWDTTSITIPASKTPSGTAYIVTDGKFYFSDFTLAAGVTVNFVGPVPPQIFVRGKADVQGTIRLNGADMTTFNGRGSTLLHAPFIAGQPGGTPGAGGGRGGKGGDECQGTGPIIQGGVVLTNGQNGEDVKLLAGHAYVTSAVSTGGRGSSMNPPTGIPEPNTPLLVVYRAFFAPGGGGGGFTTAGTASSVNPFTGLQIGAPAAGGSAFSLLPFPPVSAPPGYSSLNHFVVGGSGGGGGATHAFGTIYTPASTDDYVAGAGGSGGGGALALRSGNDMTIAGTASLQAKGGRGVLINGRDPANATNNANWGVTSPGGGGSGGSFLLQSGTSLAMNGGIDTSGGNGSTTGSIFVPQYNVTSAAGAGAAGFFRLEAMTTPVTFGGTSVPTYNAANHSGALTDRDALSGCQSLWRSTNLIFPPAWLNYELDVDQDGDGTVDVTFTDSGVAGTQLANDPNGPVTIRFQGAVIAQSTGLPIENTTGPWRQAIGAGAGVPSISLDSATGFRFLMIFNRGTFPNCVVRGLRVNART